MATQGDYRLFEGSAHTHPPTHRDLGRAAAGTEMTVTLIVRRRPDGRALPEVADYAAGKRPSRPRMSRADFVNAHGADATEIAKVAEFAREHNLTVEKTDAAKRSVVVRGTVTAIEDAFGVEMHQYDSPSGPYLSPIGKAGVPSAIYDLLDGPPIGLDNRRVPAVRYNTISLRRRRTSTNAQNDPQNTVPVAPQQIATLYNFPAGTGAGQTIGIYEMETEDPQTRQPQPAGYLQADVAATMAGFGGNLAVPEPIDVSIDGVVNSRVNDGETLLDITVSAAIAQRAQIAVYFTGGTSQSIIHALQEMIHPTAGNPQPTVISISYGWGPDDPGADSFTAQEFTQIDQLFQDAATKLITVLVSSGDSGVEIASKTSAQASLPAVSPWVVACGGTTVGNINGAQFDQFVWNDVGLGGPGATGGGISQHYGVPTYQTGLDMPTNIVTDKPGRGYPDISANASENSGYPQSSGGQSQAVGGTSAVAPLYAGLIAIINANLDTSVGFINPTLYAAPAGTFRDVTSPPGPANNSFQRIQGYPAVRGWDACTGFGSVNGTALQTALTPAPQVALAPAQP